MGDGVQADLDRDTCALRLKRGNRSISAAPACKIREQGILRGPIARRRAVQRLRPVEIEDFLCIYKGELRDVRQPSR